MAAQALQASNALKAERKRTVTIEKQLKLAHEAKAEAVAAAAKATEDSVAGQMELERVKRLAEERAALVVQAENAAVEARQQCDVQVSLLLNRQGMENTSVSKHARMCMDGVEIMHPVMLPADMESTRLQVSCRTLSLKDTMQCSGRMCYCLGLGQNSWFPISC